MTFQQVRNALKQAAELGTIREVYFEGGEPFLFYPLLVESVRLARELGMDVGIVTNGYFATTVEDAKEWLMPLQELGLSDLSCSDDVFHSGNETDTPPARTRKAAESLGINCGTICIEPPGIADDEHHPGEPIVGGGVRFRGRAVDKLADEKLPRRHWERFTECPDEDWIDVGRLHLDAYGNLWSCQGVVIGNLNKKSLREIVFTYNPDTHPIIAPLRKGGPAELVRHFHLPLHGKYLDACHLCYLARQMLREKFPDDLAPAQVYGAIE
jgi:MoaA/NifB/PqqE/SkfB family radical SAM enzyme